MGHPQRSGCDTGLERLVKISRSKYHAPTSSSKVEGVTAYRCRYTCIALHDGFTIRIMACHDASQVR